MAKSTLLPLAICATAAFAAPNCSLTGEWYYAKDKAQVITFGALSAAGSTYNASCAHGCGWETAVVD
jgi:hypothetical protein